MPEPVLSPDGRYMWIDSEWILLPQDTHPTQPTNDVVSRSITPNVSMQDSVVSGGINITQNIGPDATKLVALMLREIEKFDTSKSGFHIPNSGFSAITVINAIGPLKSDLRQLEQFSTKHLLEFCIALEPIGFSELGLTAANIILRRARSSQDKKLLAKAHILASEFLEAIVMQKDSLSHSIEATIISKEIGDTILESEALYLTIVKLIDGKKSRTTYIERIEELLSDSSKLDSSSYAYLLTGKAQHLKHTNPDYSEELEQQAFNYAKETGDIRLQLFIHMHMIDNEHFVPSNSDTDNLRRMCAINGMKVYTALLDLVSFAHFLTGEKDVISQLIDFTDRWKNIGVELEIPLITHIGEMLFSGAYMLNVHNNLMENGEIAYLESCLNDVRVANALQVCMEQELYNFDTTLLYPIMLLRSTAYISLQLTGKEMKINQAIKNYSRVRRDVIENDELKFYLKLLDMFDKGAPLDQLTHICTHNTGDNESIRDCKDLITHNIGIVSSSFTDSNTVDYAEYGESQLDIAKNYDPHKNTEFTEGLFRLGWGILLCIAPFVLIEMTGGMFIWWVLWIYGGYEIIIGISKLSSN
jgi:hypothetical protein